MHMYEGFSGQGPDFLNKHCCCQQHAQSLRHFKLVVVIISYPLMLPSTQAIIECCADSLPQSAN